MAYVDGDSAPAAIPAQFPLRRHVITWRHTDRLLSYWMFSHTHLRATVSRRLVNDIHHPHQYITHLIICLHCTRASVLYRNKKAVLSQGNRAILWLRKTLTLNTFCFTLSTYVFVRMLLSFIENFIRKISPNRQHSEGNVRFLVYCCNCMALFFSSYWRINLKSRQSGIAIVRARTSAWSSCLQAMVSANRQSTSS